MVVMTSMSVCVWGGWKWGRYPVSVIRCCEPERKLVCVDTLRLGSSLKNTINISLISSEPHCLVSHTYVHASKPKCDGWKIIIKKKTTTFTTARTSLKEPFFTHLWSYIFIYPIHSVSLRQLHYKRWQRTSAKHVYHSYLLFVSFTFLEFA